MTTTDLITDLVLAVAAALIGGALARFFRQPVIIGYLLAGVAIGAASPMHARSLAEVPTLAQIGVAFLMFALGVEFNLSQIRVVRRVALLGGVAQILLTTGLGAAVGLLFRFDLPTSLFLGSLVALSSTVIVRKILTDRGELEALHGQIAIGFLIVQDLSAVPMLIIGPRLSQPGSDLVLEIAQATAKAIIILIITYVGGTRLVPRILFWVADSGSRELFLLAIFTLALGTALLTQVVGLPLAFGAFIAGLVVSESEFSEQAIGELGPLRDLFATLFFVSLGMFIDLRFTLSNWGIILLTSVAIIIGKAVIGTAIPLAFGYPARAALATGLAISQIGEFSFVLAQVGAGTGVIDSFLYSLMLTATLITMLLSPFVIPQAARAQAFLRGVPIGGALFGEDRALLLQPEAETLTNHVVICGYGRVGQELVAALERRRFRYLVIEYNPRLATHLRAAGIPYLCGDCGNHVVLQKAGLDRARLLAIAIPDPVTAAQAIRVAKQLNRRIDIIVRSHSVEEMERLREAGAAEAVLPEFEAGLEFIRHTLHRFGVSGQEIQSVIAARRATYYRQ